ncbi:MAG: oxygenase MpaB family protein [Ferrimicrobium sp.]
MASLFFGSRSAVWKLHGDFTAMIGGLRALAVQALEPRALAGVNQFSRFRLEPEKRLRETIEFFNVTTYGTLEEVEEAIAMVRSLHTSVVGVDPVTGLSFAANDPVLLAFIHNALVESVATTYRSFHPEVSIELLDSYVDEMTHVALMIGADALELPHSYAHVVGHLWKMPTLVASDQFVEAIDLLRALRLEGVVGLLYPQTVSWILSSLPEWVQLALDHHSSVLGDSFNWVALRLGAVVGEVVVPLTPRERRAREMSRFDGD